VTQGSQSLALGLTLAAASQLVNDHQRIQIWQWIDVTACRKMRLLKLGATQRPNSIDLLGQSDPSAVMASAIFGGLRQMLRRANNIW